MGHSEDDAVNKIPQTPYWFDLKSSIELDIERYVLYSSNAPLIAHLRVKL